MNEEFIKLAAFILAGSLSGGLTNTVAIWMLFHPYEPPKLLRRWRLGFFQGAIPKNQPRLAAAIGKTVGDRLLTAEDLTQTFTDETFRATFDDRLAQFLNGVLNTERAALRDLIPERVMPDIEVLLEEEPTVEPEPAPASDDEFQPAEEEDKDDADDDGKEPPARRSSRWAFAHDEANPLAADAVIWRPA